MNQRERVLEYLQEGKVLTRLNSWNELGILEAPARISELRSQGHKIKTTFKTVVNRYGDKVHIANWSLEDRND
jgi:hypothetical protein